MATIRVLPRDDGHDVRGSWKVEKNGAMESPHMSKEAAKNKARRTASKGDSLVIYRTNGTIQSETTYRGSSDTESDEIGGFSIPGFGPKEHGKGTLDANDLL